MSKINVIYIAPIGYSGSTLMDRILGGFSGIQNIGEVKFFDQWVAEDLKCSCGQKMSKCDFWGDFLSSYPQFKIGYGKGNFKLNFLYQKPGDFEQKAQMVSENSYFLYDYILKKTQNHTIVDSSKNLGRLALLAHSGLFNIKVIQMIRNGKDVCASMKIKKNRPSFEGEQMTKSKGFWKSAIRWKLAHANLIKLVNEYQLPLLPVHMENLINDDKRENEICKVSNFCGLEPMQTDLIKSTHSISGSHWRTIDKDRIISRSSGSDYKIGLIERMIFNLIAGKLNKKFGYKS